MRHRPHRQHLPPVLMLLAIAGAGCDRAASERNPAVSDADQPASPAAALLQRSIAFHDPSGYWGAPIWAEWYGTGADGGERVAVSMMIHEDSVAFAMNGRYRGSSIVYDVEDGAWSAEVDGDVEPDSATMERMRLHRDDGFFWRNYFGFLVGLPMKLEDPGTRIARDVIHTTFMDQEVDAIKVTYDPEVGRDTWYFYFDPETAELVGCRFYHDEAANDGEYIVFEGLIETTSGLKLPRHRRWYVNADDEFLGADEIRYLNVVDL